MRKLIYSALAAIGLLLSPSCSDDNEVVNGSGNEALVSFTVNLADGIQTKAISDGTTANKLIYKVYDSSGTELPVSGRQDINKTATVNLDLVKGKTYSFLFWAQYEGENWNSPYQFGSGGTITVTDYDNSPNCNDERRDAFFATKQNFTVTGSFTETVTLERPFAQLNFLTTKKDIEDALAGHITTETDLKSSVKLSKVATTLHPFTNTVSGEATDVKFEATLVPVTFDTNGKVSESSDHLPIKDGATVSDDTEGATAYYYLATNYFLVGNKRTDATTNDRKLVDATLTIAGAEGDGLTVNNVPVEWNYRTNIYGDLLTASNKFTVIIDPGYTDDDNSANKDINSAHPVTVASTADIATQITNGSRDVTCTEAISSATTIDIPKVFNSANDTELILKFTNVAENASINLLSTTGNGEAPSIVKVSTNNGVWDVYLTSSTVTFTDGTAQSIKAATASNTLIIGEDMTVQSINATEGNVEVYGQVGISNTESSTSPVITAKSKILIGSTAKVIGKVYTELQEENSIQVAPDTDVSKMTGDYAYSINTADDLFAFAKQVNEKRNTYADQTVVLANDIDLAGRAWTPIGGVVSYPGVTFAGTFDGNGKTISNLTASDFTSNYAAAGFFGSITGKVRSLTLTNVNITSSHYAGGIVGYSSTNGAVIENCHVNGGTITSTPEMSGSSYDNGDKVGGIIGYMVSGDKVVNCSVSNVTIQAYRDLGGIAGCAAGTVTGCTATNIALIQDNTILCERDVNTFDGIVGRKENTLTIGEDCSFTIASVKVLGCQRDNNLEQALSLNAMTIEVNLAADVALNTSDFYEKRGGESTATITINGDGHKFTWAPTYRNNITTYGAKIVLNNLTMTSNYKPEGSTWDDYAIIFDCPTAISNVIFERQVALSEPYVHTLTGVTINQTAATGDMYALWIEAGADVTIANSTINATNPTGAQNRAIKIADEYVTDPQLTQLTVSGTTFKSQKKAAVLVTSTAGANITWGEGNDISEVAADTENAVWNDSDRTAAWDSVTVTGCTKIQEQ